MKVVHFFSGNPNSGAASGALNLLSGLVNKNLEIKIFNDKFDFYIEKKKIYYKPNNYKKLKSFLFNILDRLSFLSVSKKVKFSNGFTGKLPLSIDEINKFDILHLHWINNGYFNLNNLNEIKIPIVWTIRDMWPFTGGCHYSLKCEKFYEECKKCPSIKYLKLGEDKIKNLFFKKSIIYRNKKINFVSISRWLEGEMKKSKLLKDQKIFQIYNSVDNKNFFPENLKDSRKELNLPDNKFIILIGSQNFNDKIKDNNKIEEILKKLDNKFFIISFGNVKKKIKGIKNFGFIRDKKILRKIYSSANLFVSFAKQEAFGKTIVESIMCNTPVLAKDNLSSSEIIDHKLNGYLIKDDDYIGGINWIKENFDFKKNYLQLKTSNNFTINHISGEYLKLYKEILSNY
jgi:glycosyltransferase involved in cell wall biosynthesis